MKVQQTKRFIALLLAAAILISLVHTNVSADSSTGLGDIKFEWSRAVFDGVNLSHIMSENTSGLQKVYQTEFNPTVTQVEPVLSYGEYVMGGDIMSDMVSQVEQSGKKVVFAINGDAYDTSNGVSSGLMIKNGLLISTSNGSEAVGFREDGSVIYGPTALDITAQAAGTTIKIAHVNKERKMDTENVYLLTEQFDKATRSTQAGVEVVLDVTTAGYEGIKIGEQVTARVASVNQVAANPDKNTTGILGGQVVLCANSASSQYAALSALAAGQELTINVQNANAGVDWSQAKQALGIFHVLVKDGNVNNSLLSDTAIHPRTVFGTKADGTAVLFQCDGRQPGYADGLSFKEIVEYMTGIGCVNVFNFDGGGSSTITATLPGDGESTILNRPSDGQERANCNALLFVAANDAVEGNPAQKLHVYPKMDEGYGSKVLLLENGKIGFKAGATDNNYHYASLANTGLVYSTTGGIGSISNDGILTAAAGKYSGKVLVSTQDGSAQGEIAVETVDSITKLSADRSILSVAPSKTTKLSFTAEYNGVPVVLTSEALTFSLSDSSLGSVSADGTFTAGDMQGTGELRVSYKDYQLVIPVEIGKLPVLLNDFEVPLEDAGWKWVYANPGNGGSGDMSINYDERFVKTGDGSLRIDYDFATKPVTGTIAIQAGPKDALYLEGQPKAIGCWVYGDGNGAWFRIQLAPAAYAGDIYVDWVGWKYIETPIPSTASFPYQLVYGVRLICTPSIQAQNKKGTVYVDGLRAVYDFKNDDTTAPELVEGTEVSPANGAADIGHQPEISMTVHDPAGEGEAYTGINTARTKLWINGRVMTNILHETQPDGSVKISYIPSALTKLRSGVNKIKYRVEDNAGNKFFKEWSFTVEGYNVNLEETKPAGEKAAAGSTFEYIVNATDYNKFEDFTFDLSYNPLFVTLVSAETDDRLTVVSSDVDAASGTVKYKLSGMLNFQKDDSKPLVKLKFKVAQASGGQTGIKVNKAIVRETGEDTGTDLVLEGYDQEISFKYTLAWTGSTVGKQTVFMLTDSESKPVSDMGIKVSLEDQSLSFNGKTDAVGKVKTDLFGNYPENTTFKAWVEDAEGALSNLVTIPVFSSLGASAPSKIAVTTGENPATEVGISWETALGITSGNLIIGRQSDLSDGKTIQASSRDITTTLNSYERMYKAWGVYAKELEPSTVYYYKVGQGDQYSEIKSFKTAPESGDTTIAFFGDIQGSYNKFPETIEALKAIYPDTDLNLLAGDVADNGHIYSDWSAIDSGFGSYLSNGIWAATIGNHDSYFDAQSFTSLFNGPDNGTYTTPRNYYFEIGDMLIYNFDTEATYTYDPDFTGQIAKMKEVFGKSDKTYKVVLMHRSSYPMNYNEADVRKLHEVFDELKIDLVLSGHDHIYSRTEMRDGVKAEAGNGTQYVIGGSSSGSKFYGADSEGREWQDVVYDDDNPVFCALKIREGRLSFEAYAIEAGQTRMIDSFDIIKHKVSFDSSQIEGPELITEGSTAEFIVKIPEDYQIKKVTVNGAQVLLDGLKFSVSNIKQDIAIEVEYERIDVDTPAAKQVIDAINNLPSNITLNDRKQVEAVEAVYNLLTDVQKTLVTNKNVLEDAVKRIVVLGKRYDDITQISVDGDDLPDDVDLVVTRVMNKEDNTYKLLEDKVGSGKLLELYEISLVRNNIAYQPDGFIKIKLPLPDGLKGRTDLKIAHFKDDGTVQYIVPVIKDDILEFETDSLSYFGIVTADAGADGIKDSGSQAESLDKNTPNTGDEWNYLSIFLLVASSGVIVFTMKRKRGSWAE